MALEEQIERSCDGQCAEDDEEGELHVVIVAVGADAARAKSKREMRGFFAALRMTIQHTGIASIVKQQLVSRSARTRLVTTMLAMASGRRNFQPKLMSWS